MKGYTYTLYGCVVRAEFPCPELTASGGNPDVLVRYGKVPHVPSKADGPTENPQPFSLYVPGVANYLVRDGSEILVEPSPGGLESDMRLWLFGSIFSALLQQRGMLALHASGIDTGAGAVLFSGPSGIGKSTLASALIHRGYRMLADDVSAITTQGGDTPVVVPGIPRVKLWEDAIDRLAMRAGPTNRLRPGVAKFGMPVHNMAGEAVPLRRVYVLQAGDDGGCEIECLKKLDGFEAMVEQTHRSHFLDPLGERENHFRLVVKVLHSVEVCRVRRPREGFRLNELIYRLEEDFHSLSGSAIHNRHLEMGGRASA